MNGRRCLLLILVAALAGYGTGLSFTVRGSNSDAPELSAKNQITERTPSSESLFFTGRLAELAAFESELEGKDVAGFERLFAELFPEQSSSSKPSVELRLLYRHWASADPRGAIDYLKGKGSPALGDFFNAYAIVSLEKNTTDSPLMGMTSY